MRTFRLSIAVAAAVVTVAGCARDAPVTAQAAIRVRCIPVETRAAEVTVPLRGTIRPPPDSDALVAARVPGTIVAIPVREGTRVAKGSTLAVLDDRNLANARRQAESGVAQAKAALSAAEAADARKAQLLEHGIVSRAEAEAAHAEAEKARADLSSAKAALDSASADAERTHIASPIAGTVVRIFKQVGEIVDGSPGQPIVEVADTARLELRAEVPVADLVKLKAGQPAHLSVEGIDQTFEARVSSVSPAVSSDTGLGVVRIELPGETALPIGTLARAAVVVAVHPGALILPASALRGGAAHGLEAVVCEGSTARVRAVETGIHTAEHEVEIVSGLTAAESVVANGGLGIEDGAAIDVQTADAAPGATP